jgi:hypothetical protein
MQTAVTELQSTGNEVHHQSNCTHSLKTTDLPGTNLDAGQNNRNLEQTKKGCLRPHDCTLHPFQASRNAGCQRWLVVTNILLSNSP